MLSPEGEIISCWIGKLKLNRKCSHPSFPQEQDWCQEKCFSLLTLQPSPAPLCSDNGMCSQPWSWWWPHPAALDWWSASSRFSPGQRRRPVPEISRLSIQTRVKWKVATTFSRSYGVLPLISLSSTWGHVSSPTSSNSNHLEIIFYVSVFDS